jgi:hypothetical protein
VRWQIIYPRPAAAIASPPTNEGIEIKIGLVRPSTTNGTKTAVSRCRLSDATAED